MQHHSLNASVQTRYSFGHRESFMNTSVKEVLPRMSPKVSDMPRYSKNISLCAAPAVN